MATSRVFRTRLKRARESRGWSQADLAELAGLQQSALSHYENGLRRPSFTNLRKLASALEVSTDYLVGSSKASGEPTDPLTRQIGRLSSADRALVLALVESLLKARK